MIKADRLSKRYGDVVAVDDVSFEVSKAETLGLLGPNGAGEGPSRQGTIRGPE
jgi:ABC-type multidrug transport system ATPase subunit